MDPDAAETLWLAKWGESPPTTMDIAVAPSPWRLIFDVLRAHGRLEHEQTRGRYEFKWKIKEKHNE